MTSRSHPSSISSAASYHRIAVFGGTRGVGRCALERALDDGHHVTALVRDPGRMDVSHPRLSLVKGDATDASAVRAALRGADTVFCALGAPALSRSKVRSEGTRTIVAAMQQMGIERLVCVTVLGAGDSRELLTPFLRYVIFPLYLRRAVQEHEAQEAILRNSSLAWTAVRPPTLTDGPRTGHYAHGFGNDERNLTLDVSREDVADFMMALMATPTYLRQAVGVSYRAA